MSAVRGLSIVKLSPFSERNFLDDHGVEIFPRACVWLSMHVGEIRTQVCTMMRIERIRRLRGVPFSVRYGLYVLRWSILLSTPVLALKLWSSKLVIQPMQYEKRDAIIAYGGAEF